ncbi:ATPase, partial [Planktothricoides sp. FACHB-1261]|nr:ATPase [Planktothricoides raciborskii FACHB-1261]
MDINEALRVADELVLAKTGKHLDNLQQEILRGSWQGKKYSQIAKEFKCGDRHVGNVASKLWQMISEILEENVTKSRACHQLEDLTKSRRNAEVEAENFLDHQVNYAPLRSQR